MSVSRAEVPVTGIPVSEGAVLSAKQITYLLRVGLEFCPVTALEEITQGVKDFTQIWRNAAKKCGQPPTY